MKQLKILPFPAKDCRRPLSLVVIVLLCIQIYGQKSDSWKLEKMPADLETDYALSSLPPRLRDGDNVYLLDPTKGWRGLSRQFRQCGVEIIFIEQGNRVRVETFPDGIKEAFDGLMRI